MIIEQIENTLKHQFQRQVKISLNGVILKQGKFILLRPNSFALDFYIKTSKNTEIFQLPIPFGFTVVDNLCLFDYDISNILVENTKTYNGIIDYSRKNKTSKYLNNKVNIVFG